jgi:hypothetical protein
MPWSEAHRFAETRPKKDSMLQMLQLKTTTKKKKKTKEMPKPQWVMLMLTVQGSCSSNVCAVCEKQLGPISEGGCLD